MNVTDVIISYQTSYYNMKENIAKNNSLRIDEKATVIIANTIPGKGVKIFEGDYKWHGKAPSVNEKEEALEEMTMAYDRLSNQIKINYE